MKGQKLNCRGKNGGGRGSGRQTGPGKMAKGAGGRGGKRSTANGRQKAGKFPGIKKGLASQMAGKKKKLRIAKQMRVVVRNHVVVERNFGSALLWSKQPADVKSVIIEDLDLIADKEKVDKWELREKARRYIQTPLKERGTKIAKGEPVEPDLFQLAIARTKGKLVDAAKVEEKTGKELSLAKPVILFSMDSVKQLVDALPEIDIIEEDANSLTIKMTVRFHSFWDKGDVLDEQHHDHMECTIVFEEDFSKVANVQWRDGAEDRLFQSQADKLIGTQNFSEFVNGCRLTFITVYHRTTLLARTADIAGYIVDTPVEDIHVRLIDFSSKTGTFNVKVNIPEEWPLWSPPMTVVSCTDQDGRDCLSRSFLDELGVQALNPVAKGNLLAWLLKGVTQGMSERMAGIITPSGFHLIYPNPTDKDTITISVKDMDALNPGELIGDGVINLWLRHMHLQSAASASEVLVLDSFFMGKLSSILGSEGGWASSEATREFEQLLRFKGVDRMLALHYVVIPFCYRSHWSLFIIVNERVNGSWAPSLILHLNSSPSFHRGSEDRLRWFYSKLWTHHGWTLEAPNKQGLLSAFQAPALLCIKAAVPLQGQTSNDCGPYMLLNARLLLRSPDNIVQKLLNEGMRNAYHPKDALALRRFLHNFLIDRAESQNLDRVLETPRSDTVSEQGDCVVLSPLSKSSRKKRRRGS